ncbi:MAG: ABC transporter substrate-binding protein [Lachnospiraceae bacterium]|nr:ABC transporter substrate-binding protein [Lachnospiraceae bacterium]
MRIFKKAAVLLMTAALFIMLSSCAQEIVQTGEDEARGLPVVGFSQLGAESDWRSANTLSMKENISEENGYTLIFDDGQQKQNNQIMAIRKFIQQEVDYIVLAPVTEEGWDTVLEEAKEAGIPVIIVDRMVNVNDENLFTAWVGSDFELEAEKLTAWMNEFFTVSGIDKSNINIVNIQGNIGASAQIGRTTGLRNACAQYGWNLLDEVSGEFTQAKGREVMEMFLKKYDNINIVYCENDNEAIGAIEAIESAGKEVGTDIMNGQIMVVSFDGVGKTALELAKQGKISCIAECNPMHGPRVKAIIDALELGLNPEKLEYVPEELFSADKTVSSYILDGKVYKVTELE